MGRKMYRNVEKRGVQRAFRVTKRRDLYDLGDRQVEIYPGLSFPTSVI